MPAGTGLFVIVVPRRRIFLRRLYGGSVRVFFSPFFLLPLPALPRDGWLWGKNHGEPASRV